MDRGAWQATVHAVAKGQMWLSNIHLFLRVYDSSLFTGWPASPPKAAGLELGPEQEEALQQGQHAVQTALPPGHTSQQMERGLKRQMRTLFGAFGSPSIWITGQALRIWEQILPAFGGDYSPFEKLACYWVLERLECLHTAHQVTMRPELCSWAECCQIHGAVKLGMHSMLQDPVEPV